MTQQVSQQHFYRNFKNKIRTQTAERHNTNFMATKKATTATKTKKVANKKTTADKLDPKRRQKMDDILEAMAENEEGEDEGLGKIAMILKLYTKGFTRKEIVAYGFNRSTTYRQTRELDRYKKAPALQYYGHDLFERRVQRLMAAKKISRDKAVQAIMENDLA